MKNLKIIVLTLIGSLLFSVSALAAPVATATVNKGVNFRADQSTSAPIWGFVTAGTILPVEAANDYWVLVSYNGKIGYVSRSYVTVHENVLPKPQLPTEQSIIANKIIADAKTYIGMVNYKFGVSNISSMTFDCSSFTRLIFGHQGIRLIWSSRLQATQGPSISKANLQPGDLVHFRIGNSTTIQHVGIYIGNGQFIHNNPSGGVHITDLSESYWNDRFVTGTRVIK
ncbi:MAG: hypothetical protein K0R18_8 [Bacillales bacterium]|jgi:cell wall-associated NlpC family hydrolase|nr:hypothetical protein [Bacillales bacterium]